MTVTYKTIYDRMAAIRKAMSAALRERPKNIAEYHRLGAEHRKLWKISCVLPENAINPNCDVDG